jgi:hypothetical protein
MVLANAWAKRPKKARILDEIVELNGRHRDDARKALCETIS